MTAESLATPIQRQNNEDKEWAAIIDLCGQAFKILDVSVGRPTALVGRKYGNNELLLSN